MDPSVKKKKKIDAKKKKTGTRQSGNLGQHKEIKSSNNKNIFLTWDFAQVKMYRKFCQKNYRRKFSPPKDRGAYQGTRSIENRN